MKPKLHKSFFNFVFVDRGHQFLVGHSAVLLRITYKYHILCSHVIFGSCLFRILSCISSLFYFFLFILFTLIYILSLYKVLFSQCIAHSFHQISLSLLDLKCVLEDESLVYITFCSYLCYSVTCVYVSPALSNVVFVFPTEQFKKKLR